MKRKIRVVLNVLIVIMVFAAWAYMFLDTKSGTLSSAGFYTLKYFTVLSNIAEGIASIIWLVTVFRKAELKTAERIKYIASVSVGLTFMTVVFFLGPLYGFLSMYLGANFWFHLVVPVVAMVEYVLMTEYSAERTDNLIAIVPMLIYGTAYLSNILLRGREGNDWYGFINWGLPVGILIFGILCIVTYGIGLLLRKCRNLTDRSN